MKNVSLSVPPRPSLTVAVTANRPLNVSLGFMVSVLPLMLNVAGGVLAAALCNSAVFAYTAALSCSTNGSFARLSPNQR